MKTPIEWYRELYQHGSGTTEADIAAIQADALDGLRDRFACAALTGLLAGVPANLNWSAERAQAMGLSLPEYYADAAFTYADAMMIRRAQTTGAPAPAKEP